MLVMEMPNLPPQNAPVMIAQANQAKPGDVKTTHRWRLQPSPEQKVFFGKCD